MNDLYLYLYSDWAGPNLEVGRVVLNWAGLNRYVILSMQLIWVDQKLLLFIAD